MKKINYYSRDFNSIRTELIEFIKKYYPDTYIDFNDASIGMCLIELNAALGDMLSFNIDRAAQETLGEYAQERKSLFAIARTKMLKIPSQRPAVTIVDFSVTLPVNGDTFDLTYAPLINRGAQVLGGGVTFESLYDIDFKSPYSANGIPNRTIVPQVNTSGIIQNYIVTKREIVVAGKSKVFKQTITNTSPFYSITLPDADVLSVEDVIFLDGINYSRTPTNSEWNDENNKFYQVESLAQQKVFVEQTQLPTEGQNILVGQWKQVDNKYSVDFDDLGYANVRFGGGTVQNTTSYSSDSSILLNSIRNYVNYESFGVSPRINTTCFIKYRVGGGQKTNVGVSVLRSLGDISISVNGSNANINGRVISSLKVNNPLPAMGGRDALTIEEVRNLIGSTYASQERCVALKDYVSRVSLMDGRFGSPYKVGAASVDNKVRLSIIGLATDGSLSNSSTNVLKQKIEEYLSNYKSDMDFVEVVDGKILNIGFEFDIFNDKNYSNQEIAREIINRVYNYFQEQQLVMGEDVYLSNLLELVNNVAGVLNVVDMRVYNLYGGSYSLNRTTQKLVAGTTNQIDLTGTMAIYANYDEVFEIKNKNLDIKVRFSN